MNTFWHRLRTPAGISLALGIFALCLCDIIVRTLFAAHSVPTTMDEYNAFYQAEIFLSGRLSKPFPKEFAPLVDMYMVHKDGMLFSKYPPGFSAVVAIFMLLGIPEMTNTVLIGFVVWIFAFICIRQLGMAVGVSVILLMLSNAYFLAYATSLFNQVYSMLCFAGALLLYQNYLRSGNIRLLIGIGVTSAALVFARPLDGVCLALASGMMILSNHDVAGTFRRGFAIAVPHAIGWLLFMSFNWLQSGCFCIATYDVLNTLEFHIAPEKKNLADRIENVITNYTSNFDTTLMWLWEVKYLSYVGPALLCLAGLGMLRPWNRLMAYAFLFTACMVLLYNFHLTHGYPTFGARYWYPCFLAVILFAGYGLRIVYRIAPELLPTVMLILLSVQVWQSWEDLRVYGRRAEMRLRLRADMEMLCPPPAIVMLMDPFNKPNEWPSFIVYRDMMRNSDLSAPFIFVPRYENLEQIQPYFPEYRQCHYILDPLKIPMPPRIHPYLNWNLWPE